MGLIRWFTKNWAGTEQRSHWDLTPLVLPLPPGEAVELVRSAVGSMPRWRVEAADAPAVDDGADPKTHQPLSPPGLHLTRRTRVFGFVDDIWLRFLPAGPGCMVHAESRSRAGVGDLGQNRRNILELWAAIRAKK